MSVIDNGGEDRLLPAIVYGLYLLGLVAFITIPVGLIVAWANKGAAGPRTRSHYVFQIRTLWTALGWWVIGLVLIIFGVPFSFVLVGLPFLALGLLIFSVGHIWFGLRCLVGCYYLARGEGHPRPRTWLF